MKSYSSINELITYFYQNCSLLASNGAFRLKSPLKLNLKQNPQLLSSSPNPTMMNEINGSELTCMQLLCLQISITNQKNTLEVRGLPSKWVEWRWWWKKAWRWWRWYKRWYLSWNFQLHSTLSLNGSKEKVIEWEPCLWRRFEEVVPSRWWKRAWGRRWNENNPHALLFSFFLYFNLEKMRRRMRRRGAEEGGRVLNGMKNENGKPLGMFGYIWDFWSPCMKLPRVRHNLGKKASNERNYVEGLFIMKWALGLDGLEMGQVESEWVGSKHGIQRWHHTLCDAHENL